MTLLALLFTFSATQAWISPPCGFLAEGIALAAPALLPQDPSQGADKPEDAKDQKPADTESDEVDSGEVEPLTAEQAAEMLELAYKSRELDLILVAIEEAGLVPDRRVVKELAPGLKHKDLEVRLQTIRALRYNTDPDALKELLKAAKNKLITEQEECAENYYLALGQKADKKAIPVLTKNLHITNKSDRPTRARIAALGRIRDVESVKELIDIMNSGRARRQHPNMKEITLSLQVLTGQEIESRDEWQRWWNDNKNGYKLPETDGKATNRKARAQWTIMWAQPEDAELMEEALKRGHDEFVDADEETLKRLREKAERQKKKEEDKKE